MKHSWLGLRQSLVTGVSALAIFAIASVSRASTAYGTLNNFDCVNDTGVEAHGFEIELDDVHSVDITYTYDYNHYGVPKITEGTSDPLHPKVFVRYAATRNSNGSWSAYTAVPSGPITPTDGHQFTNPAVNFGGEHFGVGYYGVPSAVKYNWLIDDGAGNLIHGPPVYIATPTFAYYPPAPAQPVAQVQAVVELPPPENPPPVQLQFGEAMWVKDIKTTTHNAQKVELVELVDPDPDNPTAPDWTNGEPAEVETEWRILQTEFANPDNPKGVLAGVPEDLPEGNEVVTRRYEFYKYIGPFDAESHEAMADQVGPDGIHGAGTVTYNDHVDPDTGEWVTVTVDLSTIPVVGDFIGAQMSGFDPAPALGLIDHIPDGELGVPYAPRSVVVPGGAAFAASVSGALPDGTTLDPLTGVFAGTPTQPGAFTFTVEAADTGGAFVSKAYTVTIPGNAPATSTISTSVWPVGGGTTSGDGVYQNGTQVTVAASHSPGYAFMTWTENGTNVSNTAAYPFTASGDRALVANFVPVYVITTSAAPLVGGTTSGDGTYFEGDNVTVQASANAGYTFLDWTEAGTVVSSSASYSFNASVARDLVAQFSRITYTISASAAPSAGGNVTGGGTYNSGDNVSLQANANAGYGFVNWTESGNIVSTSSAYAFSAASNRSLVANFVQLVPVLEIRAGSATRVGSKLEVPLTILNTGTATADAVSIASRKSMTLDGKAANERAPILLGNIGAGGSATASLTFSGVKAGSWTLQVTLSYTGGTATVSVPVIVP
jgi:hypothetical protein